MTIIHIIMESGLKGKAIKFLDSHSNPVIAEVYDTKDNTIRCMELLRPEDIKVSRHIYFGDRELYRTSNFFEISQSSVQEILPICTLKDYPGSKGILIRQTYDKNSKLFNPSTLPSVCLCRQPLNPDMPYIICQKCNQIFHSLCLTDTNSCPDCSYIFKRQRIEENVPESPKKQIKTTMVAKSRNIDNSSLPLDADKYQSLTEEGRERLQQNVWNVHLNFMALQSSLSSEEKIRHQLDSKIVCALYLSIEENRGLGIDYSLQELEKKAMEIEASIYYSTGSNANSQAYKGKVRSLLFNLCDEKNPDFRFDILKGEISPAELSKMQSRDMASSAIKNFRVERKKKYTEEQLVLPTADEKLVVKTHKGEAVFMPGEVVTDMTSTDILDTVLTKSKSTDSPTKVPKCDDPFDIENYEGEQKYEVKPKNGEGINERIFEIVKDWTPKKLSGKLKDTIHNYLEESQAKRVISRINFLSNN
ncbi:unnamed protein product [Blepharisma stoltei]|uniref:TFIIS central domain-containing protein n=1 Tax=Blepharisma stoltei TaxID=1481888 RepID=A0AAU9IG00_9CILI|nr:unnamed protein product [Blepharisma stoltei]